MKNDNSDLKYADYHNDNFASSHRRGLTAGKVMKILAVLAVVIMVVVVFQPPVERSADTMYATNESAEPATASAPPMLNFRKLMSATTNHTDTDGDGLPNSVEDVLGTNPNSTDTDGDNLDDYYEISRGMNPRSGDTNNDGLADGMEVFRAPDYFTTGFENKSPELHVQETYYNNVLAHWGISTAEKYQGYYSFEFWGRVEGDLNHDNEQSAHLRLYDMNKKLGSMPRLSYWIYHKNGTMTNVSVGATFTDGTTLRNYNFAGTYIEDQYGERAHPGYRSDPTGRWYFVEFNLTPLSGKNLKYITLTFDYRGTNAGTFDTFVDNIRLWEDDEDGDGVPDFKDPDNDGDGVQDGLDLSPFTSTGLNENYQFNIKGDGKPTELTVQMRPENVSHMNYVSTTWNWPGDDHGQMQDLDRSTDDVHVLPVMEMQMPGIPSEKYSSKYGMLSSSATSPRHWSGVFKSPNIGDSDSGGGATIGDINHNGIPDAIFMGIDSPSGANRFWYRIAWDLHADGTPSSWSPTYHSPHIGDSDQGGGVDIWDIDDNGVPDLVFMGVDNPSKANRFWYMIAWNIGTDGAPAKWSGFYKSPEIGWSDAGGGLAIGDINHDGRPDFLFTAVDNPSDGKQKLWYMIGWDIGTDGICHNWGARHTTDVIGKYFYASGVKLKDLNGDGTLDMFVAGIYGIAGNDEFKYFIGWDMDSKGNVKNWSHTQTLGGTGYYAEGGGVAIGDINHNGYPDVLLMSVDSPSGPNAFRYRVGFDFVSKVYVPLYGVKNSHGNVVALEGEMYLPSSLSSNASINASFKWLVIGNSDYRDKDGSVHSRPIVLAVYGEKFKITGFAVMDSYGAEEKFLYGGSRNDTMRGYLVLKYNYLKKNMSFDSAGSVLSKWDITMAEKNRTYDTLVDELSGMQKEVSSIAASQPAGRNMPLIYVSRNTYKSVSLRSYASGPCAELTNTSFSMSMLGRPALTTRTLSLLWVNTTSQRLMTAQSIASMVRSWSWLDMNNRTNVLSSLLLWNGGDSTVLWVNDTYVPHPVKNIVEEINKALERTHDVISVIDRIVFIIDEYYMTSYFSSVKDLALDYIAKEMGFNQFNKAGFEKYRVLYHQVENEADDFADLSKFSVLSDEFEELEVIGTYSTVETVLNVLAKLAIVATVVILIYTFVSIASAGDWSLMSVLDALVVVSIQVLIIVVLVCLASLGLAGAVIAGVLAITLLILDLLGISSKIIAKIVKFIVTGVPLVKMGLDFEDSLTTLSGDSGMVAGSELQMNIFVKEHVHAINGGGSKDVSDSYLSPHYSLDSTGDTRVSTHAERTVTDHDNEGHSRYVGYDLKNTVKFLDPGINEAVTMTLSVHYAMRYEVELFHKIKLKTETAKGEKDVKTQTLYFDVLPATFDGFLHWHAIKNNDVDHDGLSNSVENSKSVGYALVQKKTTHAISLQKYPVVPKYYPGLQPIDLSDTGEKWELTKLYDGSYRITSMWNPLWVLDGDGERLYFAIWHNASSQHWFIESQGSYYIIKQKSSGAVIDGNGKDLYLKPELGNDDWQMWGIMPAASPTRSTTFDSDGDGLSDETETYLAWQYGLNPNNPDTDGDHLNDYQELMAGTNPALPDTDGDNLTDYTEITGWNIVVNYSGYVFTEHVYASPLMRDTDGDGLTDYQEWLLHLNPESRDTNGDGIPDSEEKGLLNTTATRTETALDSDGDGLSDALELAGWNVTFRNATGVHTIHVSSNPYQRDSDGDGLSDYNEYLLSTNPMSPDTDGDGLTDYQETEHDTDPLNYDTDSDGLTDGAEVMLGTNPHSADSDGDNITDAEEVRDGTNPLSSDTDGDGLSDYAEMQLGTNPCIVDTDFDGLSDYYEVKIGTSPTSNDTDGDGVPDGEELALGGNPLSNDTDGDGILDGEELAIGTDLDNPDTDGDGIGDGFELRIGTNPMSADYDLPNQTALGAIIDGYTPSHIRVALLADNVSGAHELIGKMADNVNLSVLNVTEFMLEPDKWQYVVLIGNSSNPNGSVWSLIYSIMENQGLDPEAMKNGTMSRIELLHGVWRAEQSVVVLDSVMPVDPWLIPGLLANEHVRIQNGSYSYESEIPSTDYSVNSIRAVDAGLVVHCSQPDFMSVQINKTSVKTLTMSTGLRYGDVALNKYVTVNMQRYSWENVNYMWVYIFFTAQDLRNGSLKDGAGLVVYGYNYSAGRWQPLSPALPWVNSIVLNTTAVVIGGKQYAGYLALNVSNVSAVQSYALAASGTGGIDEQTLALVFVLVLSVLFLSGLVFEYRRKKRR